MIKRSLRGRISPLHLIVLSLSFAVTIAAWQVSISQTTTKVEQRFDAARDTVVGLIHNRMRRYEDALWAGVSAMESHGDDMTLDEWRIFAQNMRIQEKYPGINGIGVIHYIPPQLLAPYLAQRTEERPDFRIYPPHEETDLMPISFIEPEGPNAAAIGLDIAHETHRRAAALASRDTGHARITGPIVLVQDAGATPGFLFYAPFYRNGVTTTLAARRDHFAGTVYAPFVVQRLMQGLLAKEARDVSLSITDAGEVIYDEHNTNEALHDPKPLFVQAVTLDLYGRQWTLDIRSNLAFRDNNTYVQPTMIFFAGLMIEALIISLMVMMSRANAKAVSYAKKVTSELRSEKTKLAISNAELEQFAYVISHDLKTPIRGISALTDMLKEDLHDYLKSDNTNPEVATALDLIQDRVQRMNDLTSGILEFSCIGENHDRDRPLSLQQLMTSLLADFDLSAEQLVLDAAVDFVTADTINLSRVLENLIGNAVKYHDGVAPLRIRVTVQNMGGTLAFTVSDNGPGIDKRFHTKIFDMFQTLRTGDAPESTGIGLAIVKKSVELHGGEIQLVSQPGSGTSFMFSWPNETQEPSAAPDITTAGQNQKSDVD